MKRELVIGNTGQDGAYLAGFLRRTQTKVDRFRKTNALAAPAASDSSAPSASLFFNTWEAVRRGAAPQLSAKRRGALARRIDREYQKAQSGSQRKARCSDGVGLCRLMTPPGRTPYGAERGMPCPESSIPKRSYRLYAV